LENTNFYKEYFFLLIITEKYENNLKADLRDPVEAAEYLNAALEDGSQEVFLMA